MGFSGSGEAELVPRLRFAEFRNSLNWKRKSLSELFAIGSGKDYKHLEKGKIPVYGTGGYMLSVDGYLHDGESVCIGRKGTIDKPMFLCGKFWTVDTLFYTHSFKNCLPKFIYFCFQNIKWLAYNEATGVPSLSKSIIEKIEIKIPALEEQSKISGCLSSIDDLIDLQIKKLDLLKAHKKGLMSVLFPCENQAVPKLRFDEFKIAKKWQKKRIGELGDVITGNTPSTAKPENYDGERLFVSPADISHKRFIYKTKTTLSDQGFSQTRHIKAESVLFVCIGSTIGKVAQNFYECATNQQINSIIPNSENFGTFVFYSLQNISEKISFLAGKTAVPIINKSVFSSVEVLLPSKKEQEKIANCLSSLDDLILLQDQKINALKSHKRGLMQVLFPILD